MAIREIPEDEELVACPSCNYFETRLKESTANFFYCKAPRCGKASCYVCKAHISKPSENYWEDVLEYMQLEEEKGLFFHFKCFEFKDLKKEFDEAFDKGTKNFCPSCGVGGMKNDACTHMTCPNCHTMWCYVCEKKESEVQKAHGKNDIYGHNENWITNRQRCPMYLTEIGDVDDRWPSDENDALEMFHKLKLLRVLKEFVTKIGVY